MFLHNHNEMEIPHIIHYCWFGRSPLPELAIKCIESWKKYLPEYEIKEWNEDNFDVNSIPYTKEAYSAKKYAFVSDYARFWILYNYGGVYFDTDVEVIKPMDDIIERGPFMGCEDDPNKTGMTIAVAPGLGIGAYSHNSLYYDILKLYSTLSFYKQDGTYNQKTVVSYTTELLFSRGLKNETGIQIVEGVYIYPKEYFCPLDEATGVLKITEKSYSIHHYSGSWFSPWQKMYKRVEKYIGRSSAQKISKLIKSIGLSK